MLDNSTAASHDTGGKSNLTKVAYVALKNIILMNKIKIGECLSGSQLAKKLKMSRTPVREALNILASEGLVEIRNGAGIYIKKVSEKDMLELLEVRSTLECSALESRTLDIDTETLNVLYEGWLAFQDRIRNGRMPSLDEVMGLDYQTHEFIVHSSKNDYLVELTKNVSDRVKQAQYLSVLGLDDLADTVKQHIGMLEAIRSGDIPQSARLLRSHIMGAAAYILNPASTRGKKTAKTDNC